MKKFLKILTCFIVSFALVAEPVALGVSNAAYVYATEVNELDSLTQNIEVSVKLENINDAKLSWNKIDSAEEYAVYRSENGTEWINIAEVSNINDAELLTYSDCNLTHNKKYYYKVSAYGLDQQSNRIEFLSNIVTVKTEKLVQPSISSITANEQGIQLTWSAVEDASHFEIYRKKTGNKYYGKIGTSTSHKYMDSTVGSYFEYTYKIKAVCSEHSDCKSVFSTTISDYSRLKTPVITVSNKGTDFVKLKWKKVPNATMYKVFKWKDAKWKYCGKTDKSQYTNSNLFSGKKHIYKVVAYRQEADKTVAISEGGKYTTTTKFKGTSAIDITSRTKNSATIKWKPIKGVTKYRVYVSRAGAKKTKVYEGVKKSYKLNNMYQSKDYTVYVCGYGNIGGIYTESVERKTIILNYGHSNFSKLGLDYKRLINNLKIHEDDKYYIGTPYRSIRYLRSESKLTVANGHKRSSYKAMNCSGFVAAAFKDAGADLSNVRKYGYSGGAANACNWVNFFYKSGVKYYKYSSFNSLLKSGRAEKGDVICRVPYYYSPSSDYHMAIFWGNTPSHNRVWHSTIQGGKSCNQISYMPNAGYSCYYMLVKLEK